MAVWNNCSTTYNINADRHLNYFIVGIFGESVARKLEIFALVHDRQITGDRHSCTYITDYSVQGRFGAVAAILRPHIHESH